MVEPDVALTDFAITLVCGVFAAVLARGRSGPTANAFVWLFAFTGGAALVGGVAHGFYDLEAETTATRGLWFVTMAFTGATGAALWLVVVALVTPPRLHPLAQRIIVVEWFAYLAWVAWVDRSFVVAIVQYAVPALVLLVVFVARYARRRDGTLLVGAAAIVLTFAAGALQQAGYSPIAALTHNAFFHILQILALTGLFMAARHIDDAH